MDKEEARQFKARWRMVNDFTAREMREATLEFKLEQLAIMYEAGQALGWAEGLRAGEEEVRARWQRLRDLYRARA